MAACDEALATESLPSSPSPSSISGAGLTGPPTAHNRSMRAQALFWRARARALSVSGEKEKEQQQPQQGGLTSSPPGGSKEQQHRDYVMTLALKDLAEAVRLEPGDRAIRCVKV